MNLGALIGMRVVLIGMYGNCEIPMQVDPKRKSNPLGSAQECFITSCTCAAEAKRAKLKVIPESAGGVFLSGLLMICLLILGIIIIFMYYIIMFSSTNISKTKVR